MPDKRAVVSDRQIIEALRHSSPRLRRRDGSPDKPWLYAAADKMNSRIADLGQWFVTGPVDRRGYIKGPFSHDQVLRVVATGRLRSVCKEDGTTVAYELAR